MNHIKRIISLMLAMFFLIYCGISQTLTQQNEVPSLPTSEIKREMIASVMSPQSKVYKFKILASQLKNSFDLDYDEAFTFVVLNDTLPISGRMIMQLYKRNSVQPSGFYWGDMKNGMADGYGFLARHKLDNELGDMYFVYEGFWKKGELIKQNQAQIIADSVSKAFDFNKYFFQNNISNIRTEIFKISELLDPINPSFTNSGSIVYKMSWENGYDHHWAFMPIEFNDLFDDGHFIFLRGDPNVTKSFNIATGNQSSGSEGGGLLGMIAGVLKQKFYGTEYVLDDYTLIRETGWNPGDGEFCGVKTDEYTGRTKDVYEENFRKDYTIITKSNRNDNWKEICVISLTDNRGCFPSPAQSYFSNIKIEDFLGIQVPGTFKTTKEAFSKALSYFRQKYPYPINDTTHKQNNTLVKSKRLTTEEKFFILKQRFLSNQEYDFTKEDSLAGIWYNPLAKALLFLKKNSEKFKVMFVNSSDLNNKEGYQRSIYDRIIKKTSYRQIEMRKTDETLIEKFNIKLIEKDKIYLVGGNIWKRLLPSTSYTDVVQLQPSDTILPATYQDDFTLESNTISNPTEKDSTFTDSRDGQIYTFKTIGNQVWMTQNLNYAFQGSTCYQGIESNCKTYGRLYRWEKLTKVAPKGWHVPSKSEWDELVTFLGGNSTGGKMKSESYLWRNPNVAATNSSGFNALPGGNVNYYSGYSNINVIASWWSSTLGSSKDFVYALGLRYDLNSNYTTQVDRYNMSSIRCIRD